ncbi:acyltransferase [Nocardia sp. CDC159]|uniref:Acyltransferase n=1 Tax=Nocardia pulmonis TaxID=2951408 RepID=A0A9X2E5L0_9NOCA|nr:MULTISPECIES: acyltransferase family protein [Nocardia]MCM6774229.1 acyltransferase [Nocardia pulmonis]MCM6787116.1 acyltransferase [Nocardia sp. CDC159]
MVTATTTIETAAGARTGGHRRDLDGLRGIAIALVVVFHIWVGRVSGGVDVFLVLSGFFFTGSLLRRVESVGVATRLRRLARRLLPAMVVVLAAVAAATLLLRPVTQWADLAQQTLASLLYYQNWQLALTWSDYLAADPSVSPLQHLWSMSVQGQFYLAALLAIAATAGLCRMLRQPSAIRPLLAALIVAGAATSFGYAAHGVSAQQGWNYYDSAARAWELLAGAGLALIVPHLSPSRALRALLAAAGLAGVLLCGWLVDGVHRFPGPAALLPVGAAAALIVAGANVDPRRLPLPNRLLAAPVPVALGELAYALYLWHWPILVFVLAEAGAPRAGLSTGVGVLAVSLALALLTHRLVEQPLRELVIRRAAMRYRRTVGVLITTTGITIIGSVVAWHAVLQANPPRPVVDLDPLRYPGAQALTDGVAPLEAPVRPSVYDARAELPAPTRDGCIADWNTRSVVTCVYGDAAAGRTLAVVGNSHAEHWMPALQVLAERHHFRLLVHLKMGCPLTLAEEVSYKGEPNPDCRDWSREVIDLLAEERPDWVFTTATRPADGGGDETPADYVDVWSALSQRGLNVIAVRDTPWLRRNGIRYRGIDCLADGGTPVGCGMRRADALAPVDPAAAPAAAFPNVFPLDLSDAFCDREVCPVVIGNVLVYHDEHHLTASYSRTLAPELDRRLRPILGWW